MNLSYLAGLLTGLLFSALIVLQLTIRFVASDLDGFRRWLDKGGVV